MILKNYKIIQTADGSSTVQLGNSPDTYHSVHGAMQESNHVFIRHGLEFFVNSFGKGEIRILEIGFGTGLNALLSILAYPDIRIEYTTLEPFPLPSSITATLNYPSQEVLLKLYTCDWDAGCAVTEKFILKKIQSTLAQANLPQNYFDVVYYDAFAPNSQPELWAPEAFEKVYRSMAVPSVLTTYCAKGQVKRDLKSVGFALESLPGPPGKREMVRASIRSAPI